MDWVDAVLAALGAPATPANRRFLETWQRYEGGATANSATFNWLNTTSGSQYPAINSVGVRAFPDFATGIGYTASTIRGGYPTIVRALRAGNPYAVQYQSGLLSDLSKWASGSRTARPDYGRRILGSSAAGTPSAAGAGAGPISPAGAAAGAAAGAIAGFAVGGPPGALVGALAGAVAAGIGLGAIGGGAAKTISAVPALATALLATLAWLTDPHNLLRLGEITAGGFLVAGGLLLVARHVGIAQVESVPPLRVPLPAAVTGRAPVVASERRIARPRRRRVSLPADRPRKPRPGQPGSSQLAPGESLPFD